MTTVANATSAQPSALNSQSSAKKQMDTFLKILTTQLQNQNPLDPMKPAEFTSQLTQYSQLEQQIKFNEKLDKLLTSSGKPVISPLSYLNTTVDYFSDTAPVQNGNATWSYVTTGAANVELRVQDSTGATVHTAQGSIAAGPHVFTLPSNLGNGTPLKLVVTARDSTGRAVESTVNARARINAVNNVDGKTILEASGYFLSDEVVTRIASNS